MDIVWNLGTCRVREVREQLRQGKELAYTTVATILLRLFEKGIVRRGEKKLVVYFYPKVSRGEYSRNVAGAFFRNFFNSFGDVGIASFAESIDELPKDKREHFLKLLGKQK
jgi:predicted transcriptional regulator